MIGLYNNSNSIASFNKNKITQLNKGFEIKTGWKILEKEFRSDIYSENIIYIC